MKVDKFIETCFSDKEVKIPKINETTKLAKTWEKIIVDLKQDYGPKTKEVKRTLIGLTHDEQRIDNEKLNVRRRKIEAENNLKQSQLEDEKVLKKILGKYQGKKLFEEISRLNELPIESLVLVNKVKKPKVSSDGLFRDHNFPPIASSPSSSPTGRVISSTTATGTTTLGTTHEWMTYNPTTMEEIEPVPSENSIKTSELPFLVIITKSLKTEIPSKEELQVFSLFKRLEIKSWGDREIGRFMIILDLEGISRDRGLRIFNLEKIADGNYDHACISNSSVCLGNRSSTFDKLGKNYQIFDMIDLLFDYLVSVTTARPVSSPYIEWDKWFDRVKPVTKSFNEARIKAFLNGGNSTGVGSITNLLDSVAYTSWDGGTPTTTASPYASVSGSRFDPLSRDPLRGTEEMATHEMRRHLDELRREQERREYSSAEQSRLQQINNSMEFAQHRANERYNNLARPMENINVPQEINQSAYNTVTNEYYSPALSAGETRLRNEGLDEDPLNSLTNRSNNR